MRFARDQRLMTANSPPQYPNGGGGGDGDAVAGRGWADVRAEMVAVSRDSEPAAGADVEQPATSATARLAPAIAPTRLRNPIRARRSELSFRCTATIAHHHERMAREAEIAAAPIRWWDEWAADSLRRRSRRRAVP